MKKEEARIKILMLISSLELGGVETHVYELSRAISMLGAEVTIASNGGVLSKKLSCFGIRHISLPLDSRKPLSLFRSYMGVRKLLRDERFDIVHAHSRIAAYIGNAVANRYGVSFVTTVHAKFSISPLKRRISRWGEYTSAVSEDLAAYLSENYRISRDRIRVIPNGIDIERFESDENKRISEDIRIIFVSRLDSDCSESAYSLCRIAEKLAEICPRIKITIVGGGEEYGKILLLSEEINTRAGYMLVEAVGGVSEVEKYLAQSDIFVGVSRAALEAASSGARVILSGNEGFLGALCEDNVEVAERSNFCCRGYPKTTDEKLFESISKLIAEDREASLNTASFLRNYIVKYHGIANTASQTLAFYREALAKKEESKSRICLCGYYGFGNVGDDSLLLGAIERAREENSKIITVLSKSPKETERIFGVRCVSRYAPISVMSAIRRSDRLVFGGGTLFQDGTSLRSIVYYSALVFLAAILKREVELWANGLGPVKSRAGKKLLSGALKRASYIGLRDNASRRLALGLGADEKKMTYEQDLAFSLIPPSDEHIAELMRNFGFDIFERFAVFSISGRADKQEYTLIKKRAEKFLREGVCVILVGMYPKEDRMLSQKLCREIGGKYIENIGGGELISLLRNAEAAVGMRLHLLIFSKAAGTVFTGVGKEPKIISFCKENQAEILS